MLKDTENMILPTEASESELGKIAERYLALVASIVALANELRKTLATDANLEVIRDIEAYPNNELQDLENKIRDVVHETISQENIICTRSLVKDGQGMVKRNWKRVTTLGALGEAMAELLKPFNDMVK